MLTFSSPLWQVLLSSPVDKGSLEKGSCRPEATEPGGGRDRIQVQWSRSWPALLALVTAASTQYGIL